MTIDYAGIIDAIKEQVASSFAFFQTLPSDDEKRLEVARITGIDISDEQNFIRLEERQGLDEGKVYLVVKFGSGSLNFGSAVAPISIYAIGTANRVKPIQYLLSQFVTDWSTKTLYGFTSSTIQLWNMPEVMLNFNEFRNEFRNLLIMSGNIVMGDNSVSVGTISYIYDESESPEIIQFMTIQDNYNMSLNTQPFGNTEGFATSEGNFSTYSFSISTYLLKNHLTCDVLSARGFKYGGTDTSEYASTKKPNDPFKIKITFSNGYTNDISTDTEGLFINFKCVQSGITQNIGGIPMITMTFSR